MSNLSAIAKPVEMVASRDRQSASTAALFKLAQANRLNSSIDIDDFEENVGPTLVISPRHLRILPAQSDMQINGIYDEEQALAAKDSAAIDAAAIIALNPDIIISAAGIHIRPSATAHPEDLSSGGSMEDHERSAAALSVLSGIKFPFVWQPPTSRIEHGGLAANSKNDQPAINWLSMRNIKWTTKFYDAMHTALRVGAPASRKERMQIAKSMNSKRFWEYWQHLTLQNDKIVLVSQTLPPWMAGKDGQAIAHVTLPLILQVTKQDDIHAYLSQAYSNPANNAYRACNAFYKRVSSQTLGISRTDIEQFVANQEVSQMQLNVFSKVPGLIVKPLRPVGVLQWWEIDLIDVAMFSSKNNGIHFLMVVIDIFSKYCWICPLKTKHGNRVAFELQNIFLQNGSPTILQSDNGAEFRNAEMAELAQRWNVERRHSLPYRSQTNGAVEKMNHTIERAIQSYMLDWRTQRYIDVLPLFVFSYNTTVHSTTRYQPYVIHHGREVRLPKLNWSTTPPSEREPDNHEAQEADLEMEMKERDEPTEHDSQSAAPNSKHHTSASSNVVVASDNQGRTESDVANSHALKIKDAKVADLPPALPDPAPSNETLVSYVMQSQALRLNAQTMVAARINDAADKMVIKSANKFSAKKHPRLQIGAKVRLDLLAITRFRKDQKSFKRKLDQPNWSKTVYTIAARTDATKTSPDVYRLVDASGEAPEDEHRRREYYRYQLMTVNDEDLAKLHDQGSKPADYTFGIFARHVHANFPIEESRQGTAYPNEGEEKDEEERDDEFHLTVQQADDPAHSSGRTDLELPGANGKSDASLKPSPPRHARAVAAPKNAKGFYQYY